MPILYLNGQFVEHQEASLDPLDRGMLLGDGVFETIRCERGQILFHVAHFSRLARSARILEIAWNMAPNDLLSICHQILDANNLETARLRVTLSRGEMGPSPLIGSNQTAPTLIVHASGFNAEIFDQQREHGYTAQINKFPINHHSPLAQVKSTSYQEHLLARHYAQRDNYDEAILLNTDGLLAECSMSNLFIVRDGTVYTPPVEDGALPGILRLKINLICNRLEIPYKEEHLTVEDLHGSDEAFITNSLMEVMPLTKVGNKLIANGLPGKLTSQLFKEHRLDVEQFLTIAQGD